jgi:hypothetical protein
MYSGTTIGNSSGNFIGAHQRIDRIARRALQQVLEANLNFPSITQILYFEGNNGPDAVKRKSPSVDEPWHYINPKNPDDHSLVTMIEDHIINLSIALHNNDGHRAAFEAAWLAHAVVDGLTPAHHFPLADKIEELFGKPHHERKTIKEKNLIQGHSRRDTISKNWQYWGPQGIFSAHTLFEHGIATSLLTWRGTTSISNDEITKVQQNGYGAYFRQVVAEIDSFALYDRFQRRGWSTQTARLVRKELFPRLVKSVTLAWYIAAVRSTA